MSDLIEATKTCSVCGRRLNLSEFPRDRRAADGLRYECRTCNASRAKANAARRRAEMGEDAYLAHVREVVRRSRERKPEATRRYNRAQARAVAVLRENHRSEYDRLLAIELRREESA